MTEISLPWYIALFIKLGNSFHLLLSLLLLNLGYLLIDFKLQPHELTLQFTLLSGGYIFLLLGVLEMWWEEDDE